MPVRITELEAIRTCKTGLPSNCPWQEIGDEAQRKLIRELKKLSRKPAKEYGFYDGSILILIEDLKPICSYL